MQLYIIIYYWKKLAFHFEIFQKASYNCKPYFKEDQDKPDLCKKICVRIFFSL